MYKTIYEGFSSIISKHKLGNLHTELGTSAIWNLLWTKLLSHLEVLLLQVRPFALMADIWHTNRDYWLIMGFFWFESWHQVQARAYLRGPGLPWCSCRFKRSLLAGKYIHNIAEQELPKYTTLRSLTACIAITQRASRELTFCKVITYSLDRKTCLVSQNIGIFICIARLIKKVNW